MNLARPSRNSSINCFNPVSSPTRRAAYQAELATRPLTLVHGDFHPANIMIVPPTSDRPASVGRVYGAAWVVLHAFLERAPQLSRPLERAPQSVPQSPLNVYLLYPSPCARTQVVLLDFEQVGVGSGPQDLGQYLISHASPETRRGIEARGAVEAYYEALCGLNVGVAATMTLEQCKAEYVAGGAGRWLWFLPVLNAMCPPPMTQYFHDQLLAFLKDHNITPETVPMPRV